MSHNFDEYKSAGSIEATKENKSTNFVTNFEKQLEQQQKRMKKLNKINEDQSELIRKILLTSSRQQPEDRLSVIMKNDRRMSSMTDERLTVFRDERRTSEEESRLSIFINDRKILNVEESAL